MASIDTVEVTTTWTEYNPDSIIQNVSVQHDIRVAASDAIPGAGVDGHILRPGATSERLVPALKHWHRITHAAINRTVKLQITTY